MEDSHRQVQGEACVGSQRRCGRALPTISVRIRATAPMLTDGGDVRTGRRGLISTRASTRVKRVPRDPWMSASIEVDLGSAIAATFDPTTVTVCWAGALIISSARRSPPSERAVLGGGTAAVRIVLSKLAEQLPSLRRQRE
jgi:hypothetical protein